MDPGIFDPDLFYVHLTMVFVFGSICGSFFGLCIARIPAEQSIVAPGSYCFACGKSIVWKDNIPLISYWMLRGRCRWCGTAFSSRHFWIELLSALLFALVFYTRCHPDHGGYTLTVVASLAFTGLLLVAAFTDIDHWIIPDGISIGGAVAGIALAFIPFSKDAQNIVYMAGPFGPAGIFYIDAAAWWVAPANAAFGAAFGYGIIWLLGRLGSLLFRKEAMGGGDLKLMACIGAFLGYLNTIHVLFVGSFLGAIIGIALILWGRWKTTRNRVEETEADRSQAEDLATRAIQAIFPDDESGEDAAPRPEQAALRNLLEKPPARPVSRHHLPFGPYLAAAAFLIMLYHEHLTEFINSYLNVFR